MTLFAVYSLPLFVALLSFDPRSYIWNLGWVLIPVGVYFFALGLMSGFRRWHVNPKHINELRANRSRLRKDRDQLLEEFGLEHEELVGMEVDDEVIEARSSRRRSRSKRSSSSSSGRTRRRSSSSSRSSRSRSASPSDGSSGAKAPGSDTKSGVTRGLRSLPPTAADKERLKQGMTAEETAPKSAPAQPTADALDDADHADHADNADNATEAVSTTEPPPPADKLFTYLKNKSIESYEGFGPLFIDWPKKPDDLKRISGIGEELEGKLNDIGVFMLWQIAYWNGENVTSMADELYLEEPLVAAWVDEARRMVRR